MNISVCSIILFFISGAVAINNETHTIEWWWNEVNSKFENVTNNHPLISELREFHSKKWCVTNKVVTWGSKKKIVNFAEAMVLIYGSLMTCQQPFSAQSFGTLVRHFINSYKESIAENDIECFKIELKKINPRFYMLTHFVEPADSQRCEAVVDMGGFNDHLQNIEAIFGNLAEFSCNVLNADYLKELLLTVVVLSGSGDENIINWHIQELIVDLREKSINLFNCVFKRFKNPPKQSSSITYPGTHNSRPTQKLYSSTHSYYGSQSQQNLGNKGTQKSYTQSFESGQTMNRNNQLISSHGYDTRSKASVNNEATTIRNRNAHSTSNTRNNLSNEVDRDASQNYLNNMKGAVTADTHQSSVSYHDTRENIDPMHSSVSLVNKNLGNSGGYGGQGYHQK